MPSKQQLERTQLVVSYMKSVPLSERTVMLAAFYCDIPYSSVYEIINKTFPWMFERTGVTGIWKLTGAQPMPEYPIDFDAPLPPVLASRMVRVRAALDPPESTETARQPGWTWRPDVLAYIDTLWEGKSFADILQAAHNNGALDQLSAVGKTIARAADQMKKTGRIPF